MIREREDAEAVGAILEKEAQREVRAAFKGSRPELADSDPAVDMRLAKHLPQFMQSKQALRTLGAHE